MASMREIKLRIKSIKETRQITRAMKLISAAKLKKARQQLELTSPYFDKVKKTMADILIHSGDIENKFFDLRHEHEVKKKAYFVITGDKSLAGGYNHNILKLTEQYLKDDKDALLYVAGNMGRNYFRSHKYNVNSDFDYFVQNPTIYRSREIAERFIDDFKNKKIDEINLIYTEMVSSISLEPRCMKLLPLEIDTLKDELNIKNTEPIKIDEQFEYEPSMQCVFDILIPKYLKGIIYGSLVESFTSEQSARMSAMDSATSNADDMIQHLNLYYNRARQAVITQEISEIVGGAAALQ